MEHAESEAVRSVGSGAVEAVPVWKPEVVEEVLARLGRGEPVRRLAQEYGIDRKTIRAWRARGRYVPRAPRPRRSILDPHAAWLTGRAPEVDFNSVVLHRELVTHFAYRGSRQQVVRFVRPLRIAARAVRGTVRFETPPGQQAQVDFGQCRVWVGDAPVVAHVFVCRLGYSRRQYVEAFPHERLSAVLAGHEHAFQHFGGVPAQLVVDNAKPVVLRHLRVTYTILATVLGLGEVPCGAAASSRDWRAGARCSGGSQIGLPRVHRKPRGESRGPPQRTTE